MSTARRAALQFLGSEWNRSVWRRWLQNIFLLPVDPPMPAGAPPATPAASELRNTPTTATSACVEASAETMPPSVEGRDARRTELRSRFEALSDRLAGVEEGLETLIRRSAQRDRSERRVDTQAVDALAGFAEIAERQASALEGLLGSVARLEQGLQRVERAVDDRERRRESFFVGTAPSEPPPARPSAPPDRDSQTFARGRSASQRPPEGEDADAGASSIHGHLSELSLSTVLAMLEIERRTGRLRVATDDGLLASFDISDGSVTHCRLSENDADPLHALRTALRWKNGRFWFRQPTPETKSCIPRSIGSLLLEATQQNDESFAGVGGD